MQDEKKPILIIQTKAGFILIKEKKPMIIVFAGPNGSGKSTITQFVKFDCPYINADEIKKNLGCDDKTATITAYNRRLDLINQHSDFAFETVLSSHYNMDLLRKAKAEGYFIKCFYILTIDPLINVSRVATRVDIGGHDVPIDKIKSRYKKCLDLIPDLVQLCDVIHIYDNTKEPERIFKKRKDESFIWENRFWNEQRIQELVSK